MVNHFATAPFFCIGKAGISREGGVCLLFHKWVGIYQLTPLGEGDNLHQLKCS